MLKRLLLWGSLGVILGGCAASVPLSRDQLGAISAETSQGELDKILDKATVTKEYDFAAQSRTFRTRHFSLQTGTKQTSTVVCTPVCFPIFLEVPVLVDYVVLQERPALRLIAWGTIEELSKSPDENIASLMPELKKALSQLPPKKG